MGDCGVDFFSIRSSSSIDRSYALRGNAATDAPRPALDVTQSVTGGIPMQSVGTIMG